MCTVANGRNDGRQQEIFYLEEKDRSLKPAAEEDLYNYTTMRWLYNEAYELSRRHARFNVQGLIKKAVEVSGHGVTECIRVMKYREGEYNKVFLLTMDNGAEVVAKVPNLNAGPAHYTTASEVATMNYLREVLDVPVPRVLAWSSNSSNSVQSEFIIMEKAKGVILSDCWRDLARAAKNKIIEQIVNLQLSFSSRAFPAHGCLFFKEDVPAEKLSFSNVPSDPSQRYTIGPLVDPTLWEDGRNELNVHKGPWETLSSYAVDLGKNELEWVKSHAQPRMNYFYDVRVPEQPSEALKTLGRYLSIVPYVTRITEETHYLQTRILSHRDLNSSNVFIDPDTNDITAIIDWQGSTIAPLSLQAEIPRMVRHFPPVQPGLFLPERPGDYDALDLEGKRAADATHESILCQKYYEGNTAKSNPLLYSAIMHNDTKAAPLIEPLQIICGSWKNREVWKLRASLINITESWESVKIGGITCPLVFTEEEIQKHDKELENIDYIESIMEAFDKDGILPADGRVDPEAFDSFQEANRAQKETYVSLADDDEERHLMGETWPWQDWPERSAYPH
ncbi:putative phosphotransferase family protein [Phaeomoniella chlamydospora]|uniref:Altered inheritance of mitochondria protein 9, mitochondrial n=1 Tax=Phaeomoniella chlamydospora TaxID=158046 RepID=A0A0G2EEI7_PHACM|nr:putative phosphotransferase family protein [Phaeomoniella chlamydospora]